MQPSLLRKAHRASPSMGSPFSRGAKTTRIMSARGEMLREGEARDAEPAVSEPIARPQEHAAHETESNNPTSGRSAKPCPVPMLHGVLNYCGFRTGLELVRRHRTPTACCGASPSFESYTRIQRSPSWYARSTGRSSISNRPSSQYRVSFPAVQHIKNCPRSCRIERFSSVAVTRRLHCVSACVKSRRCGPAAATAISACCCSGGQRL